ncbi:MAG: hypothetical protein U0T72_05690 [Chitinophagales bacterium]
MKNRSEIQNELKAIAPTLSGLEPSDSFAVPENYFSQLPATVLSRIKEEEAWEQLPDPALSPLLQSLRKKQSFELPQQYFQTSAATVLSHIRKEEVQQELKEIAPQLATLPKQQAFAVPQNYFKQLPSQVYAQLQTRHPQTSSANLWWNKINETIDSLIAPLFKPQLVFAFASLFSVAIAIWFLQTKSERSIGTVAALDNQLDRISTAEVNNYISMNLDEFDEYSIKKKVGEIHSVVIINEQTIDEKKLEEILLHELDEDMILDLQKHQQKNRVI